MAPDAFSLLALPRRPWLEADLVRQAFQKKAGAAHPDRNLDRAAESAALFAQIAHAYEVLRHPGSRLLAYLGEMAHPAGELPGELMDLFAKIAAHRQKMKAIEARRGATSSRLGAVLLANECAAAMADAEALIEELDRRRESLCASIREIDARAEAAHPEDRGSLLAIAHRLAFIEKWRGQLAEMLLRLKGAA
jgi:curved DNA-binding protein CbpA